MKTRIMVAFCGFLAVICLLLASPAKATDQKTTPQPQALRTVEDLRRLLDLAKVMSPLAADARAYLLPIKPGPGIALSIHQGDVLQLDLYIDMGTQAGVGQQSYLTFTNTILNNVDVNGSGSFFVEHDYSVFDIELLNQACNGPGTCDINGRQVDPGTMAYASGTFQPDHGGKFRVAIVRMKGVAAGSATMHWQFIQPVRVCKIADSHGAQVENPALYQDINIQVLP